MSILLFLFLKGMIGGALVSAPLGPVGILCIQRALAGQPGRGILTGLGATLADSIYAAIAGFGLVSLADLMARYNFYLRGFGGLLILWIGLTIYKKPPPDPRDAQDDNLFHLIGSSFFVTLTNPIVLLVFAAVFTTLGVSPNADSTLQGTALLAGVFAGAMLWWTALCLITFLIHKKIRPTHLFWINRLSGIMLLGFGGYVLASIMVNG